MAYSIVLSLVALLVLGGCATAQKQAATQKQVAQEIDRVCKLPAVEREAQIKKIQDESGMVLYCGNQ